MQWNGLDGVVQLATFHPKYQFDDSGEDDVENFTNRSPWPLFHLLREDEVGAAVAAYGGPDGTEAIWQRNKATMRRLGRPALEALVTPGALAPGVAPKAVPAIVDPATAGMAGPAALAPGPAGCPIDHKAPSS